MAGALPPAAANHPVRVVEAGAGIGTMVERLLDRELLTHTVYDAVDLHREAMEAARSRLRAWAAAHGWLAEGRSTDDLRLTRADREVEVRFHAMDIEAYAASQPRDEADLFLAHAFLDIIDWRRSLPHLLRLLRPGGAFYFTLNFDGVTAFLPEGDAAFEERLMAAYHQSMDVREPLSGGRHTGRHLLEELPRMGAVILDAGASDWWVRPQDGAYPSDEAYFLHFLVETVRRAVPAQAGIQAADVDAWAARRHAQIDRGELVYLAHQWDVAGVRGRVGPV